MNLKELVAVIKKSYGYIFLGVAALALLIIGYIYLDNPSGDQGFGKIVSPKISGDLSDKFQLQSSARVDFKNERLLNIIKIKANSIDQAALTRALGVVGEPKNVKGILFWISISKNLSIENGVFNYNSLDNVGAKSVSEDQAAVKAKEILRDIGLVRVPTDLSLLDTKYFNQGFNHQQEVSQTGNFNVYSFNFGRKVDGLSVVDSFGSEILYSVTIRVDGTVKSVRGITKAFSGSEKSSYPAKHVNALRNDVVQNHAIIVSVPDPTNLKTEKKLEVTYAKSELVYLLTDSNFLYPVYKLETTDGINNEPVTALLPALKNSN